MISHMGNETGCPSGNDPGIEEWSDVINHLGCMSVNRIPGMIHMLLIHNQTCRLYEGKYKSWCDTQVTQMSVLR